MPVVLLITALAQSCSRTTSNAGIDTAISDEITSQGILGGLAGGGGTEKKNQDFYENLENEKIAKNIEKIYKNQ